MLGSSVTFGPLVADITHWFKRRRGIAVAIVASGNYLAGTVWPPVLQYGFDAIGWRQTFVAVAVVCVVTMVPLAFMLRRRHPSQKRPAQRCGPACLRPPGPPCPSLQVLLVIAGLACCIAMAMPQVHIVAYCVDLGFGASTGANLLSIMLGLGGGQPPHLRAHRGTGSAARPPCSSDRRCNAWHCCSICPSTA